MKPWQQRCAYCQSRPVCDYPAKTVGYKDSTIGMPDGLILFTRFTVFMDNGYQPYCEIAIVVFEDLFYEELGFTEGGVLVAVDPDSEKVSD